MINLKPDQLAQIKFKGISYKSMIIVFKIATAESPSDLRDYIYDCAISDSLWKVKIIYKKMTKMSYEEVQTICDIVCKLNGFPKMTINENYDSSEYQRETWG